MKFDLGNVRRPVFTESDDIDVELNHPDFGWIPFTASSEDKESIGEHLYKMAMAEAFGVIEKYTEPVLTNEELAEKYRYERDEKLRQLDAIVQNPLRWSDFTATQQSDIATYRSLLLDVPQQPGFPSEFEWPVIPEFLV